MLAIRGKACVDCHRDGCDGQWIFEGAVYPPEPSVGINGCQVDVETTGYATDAHECGQDTIRLSDLPEPGDAEQWIGDDVIEDALDSYYGG